MTIQISSNTKWTISSDSDWIKPSKTIGSGNDSFFVTTVENKATSSRTGCVTITAGNIAHAIRVTQSGMPVTENSPQCRHESSDPAYYTDSYVRSEWINTGDAQYHDVRLVYVRICKFCPKVLVSEIKSANTKEAHKINNSGACLCGYIDAGSYVSWKAYVQGGTRVKLYKNQGYSVIPTDGLSFAFVAVDQTPTVLAETSKYYYVDNNGAKGYALKTCLGREKWARVTYKFLYRLSSDSLQTKRDAGLGIFAKPGDSIGIWAEASDGQQIQPSASGDYSYRLGGGYVKGSSVYPSEQEATDSSMIFTLSADQYTVSARNAGSGTVTLYLKGSAAALATIVVNVTKSGASDEAMRKYLAFSTMKLFAEYREPYDLSMDNLNWANITVDMASNLISSKGRIAISYDIETRKRTISDLMDSMPNSGAVNLSDMIANMDGLLDTVSKIDSINTIIGVELLENYKKNKLTNLLEMTRKMKGYLERANPERLKLLSKAANAEKFLKGIGAISDTLTILSTIKDGSDMILKIAQDYLYRKEKLKIIYRAYKANPKTMKAEIQACEELMAYYDDTFNRYMTEASKFGLNYLVALLGKGVGKLWSGAVATFDLSKASAISKDLIDIDNLLFSDSAMSEQIMSLARRVICDQDASKKVDLKNSVELYIALKIRAYSMAVDVMSSWKIYRWGETKKNLEANIKYCNQRIVELNKLYASMNALIDGY